jgi:protoporphyrinogen oxidase
MRVGIVGGGMLGMTAALRLRQAGHDVTLWERMPSLGGQAATFPIAGTRLEYFYHHLFHSDTAIIDLMNELGVGDRLQWLPSTVGMFYDGKIWPLDGAKDLLKLGYISPLARLRVGALTAYLQLKKNYAAYERQSAAAWLARASGKNGFDRVFGAQLRAKFGPSWDKIPMVWFWKKVQLRTTNRSNPLAKETLGYPRGSFQVFIDALEAEMRRVGVAMNLGVNVESVQPSAEGGVTVRVDGVDHAMDTVVITTPSAVFKRLAPELPAEYVRKLDAAGYQAACCMLLELDRKLTDIYWLNIADPAVPFTGVIEQTNFVPPAQYGGSHLVYLSRYLEVTDPIWAMEQDELFAHYLPALRRINPAFDPSWVREIRVFRERAAQPIVPLRYSSLIPEMRTPLPNIYLANTTQIYPEDRGTNYSVALGNEIANLIGDDLAAGRIAGAHTTPAAAD